MKGKENKVAVKVHTVLLLLWSWAASHSSSSPCDRKVMVLQLLSPHSHVCVQTCTHLYILCIMLMHLLCSIWQRAVEITVWGEIITWKQQHRDLTVSTPMGYPPPPPSQSRNGNIPADSWEAHLKFIHQFSPVYINIHVEQSHTGLSYNTGAHRWEWMGAIQVGGKVL